MPIGSRLPLPPGHRFPATKYRLLREPGRGLAGARRARSGAGERRRPGARPRPALRAGDRRQRLSAAEQRAIGFPWSEAMVERARRSVGATLAAARAALVEGVAANLAGGTHHASAGSGSGYCVFNDVAVAARLCRPSGSARHGGGAAAAHRRHRPRRPPGRRHRLDLRRRPERLHPVAARREELPVPQGGERPRRRPARRLRRRRLPGRARRRAGRRSGASTRRAVRPGVLPRRRRPARGRPARPPEAHRRRAAGARPAGVRGAARARAFRWRSRWPAATAATSTSRSRSRRRRCRARSQSGRDGRMRGHERQQSRVQRAPPSTGRSRCRAPPTAASCRSPPAGSTTTPTATSTTSSTTRCSTPRSTALLIEAGALDVAAGEVIGCVVETHCNYFAPLAFPQAARGRHPGRPHRRLERALRDRHLRRRRGRDRGRAATSSTSTSTVRRDGRSPCPTACCRS